MISVMNNNINDLGMEDKPRVSVSNEGDNGSNGYGDLDMNEEVRVCGEKMEIDEDRVLGEYHANGDGIDLGVRLSSANDGDGDGENGGKVVKLEGGDVEKGGNEMGKGECEGFSRRANSGSSSGSDGGGENEVRRRGRRKEEDVGERSFKMERRGESSKDVSGSDVESGVVRGGSMKLWSGFEMGEMVWGKVKSHPWWPGHLFNQAFATSAVRRTRRDGLVLVAFFGDSSYGWFDPADLIQYDPHYAEKSQQTFSRSFVRAVEESVDEACRRSALGLSCRCRNPRNFRPTTVPGYFAVDVFDYEPGAVYSESQVQKARDSFRPAEMLSFVKQLAAAPSGENKSLDFIKSKAAALAYRRSIFEEFDETYAEAFGHKPVRPSQSSAASTDKEPSRAPLSGPLVFADSVGRKSSTKAAKPKEQLKKDRYLFKRRDESGDLKTEKTSQGHASSSSSSAYEDGTSDSAAGGYVLQKRDQVVSVKVDRGGTTSVDQVATSAHSASLKDSPTTGLVDVSGKRVSQQLEPTVVVTGEVGNVHCQVAERQISSVTSRDADYPGTTGGPLKKKKKVAKRPAGEGSSEKSDLSEKKPKKLRKTDGGKVPEHPERQSAGSGGISLVKPSARGTNTAASYTEDPHVSQKKDVEAAIPASQQLGLVPLERSRESEAELRDLLADLHGLALNPFHGMERNGPAITRQFFLKFRSLVFLKSSSVFASTESDASEARAIRSPPAEYADRTPSESSKKVSSLKPPKPLARQDDSTKVGRKRIPSERQEENAAKRAKKITDVKSLSAEKKAFLKNPEMQRVDGKAKVAAAQSPQTKPMKAQHGKKVERPPRVEEPTYLVMKFQSGSSLPSLVELKARFARFGPLDTSLSRVFYTTNTCRVAFLYKQDAHVAYRYAMGSKSLFSNVRFILKPVAAPESQQPSSGKAEDLHSEPTSNRDSSLPDARPAVLSAPSQPVQQLKSCLKKPSGGDEPGGPNNGVGSTRTARVRFNVGEDVGSASNKGGLQVQMTESSPVLSSHEGSPSSSLSSVAMDVNNNQRFLSPHPLQPPLLPHPPQYLRAPINHHQYHHAEVAPRNNYYDNFTSTTSLPGVAQELPPAPPSSADISQQMMSLLTRCHDVVTNVKGKLGYVPYHPL